jgi:glycogen operon protein
MIQMGDEAGRTQRGNNNAYCQDNALTWMDWSLVKSGRGAALSRFFADLASARRRYITLRADHYLGDAEIAPGIRAQSWWDERGQQLAPQDWENDEGRILALRRAARRPDGTVEVTALLMNTSSGPVQFQLPGDLPWMLVFDTADPGEHGRPVNGDSYPVQDRAAVLLSAELPA